jgi:CubicO group peptidase (beta-lactamase class C family)
MVAHALMGEAVRRTDPAGRSFRQIAHEDLFEPLEMHSTAFGVRKDLKARHVPPLLLETTQLQPHPSTGNLGRHGAFEEEKAEMPWVGAISTTEDVFRFAEMLRRGGELEGARIVGPAILEQATHVRTGDLVNNLYAQLAVTRGWEPYPAYIGLGFFLRGEAIIPHQFGTLASPRTFGNNGFGSTLYWVDPAREMTFVCLTAGVMNEGDNIERFQRLSDIALSAAL